MPVSAKDVLTDPRFQAFTPEQKRQVLLRIDPNFVKLSPEQQQQVAGYKPGPSPEAKEQGKKTSFQLTTGISPTLGGIAGYEGKELLGGAWDALKGMYELIKPPSLEEFKDAAITGGPAFPLAIPAKRILEGIKEPLGHAGEIPAAVRDLRASPYGAPALALQVPRTMGNLAASYELGRIVQPGYKSAAGKLVGDTARIGTQELMGAGKEPVLLAQIKYEQALEDYKASTLEKKADYAQKVADARKDWVDKAMETKRAQAAAEKNAATKETLQRGQMEYAERLRQNLKQTYQTVKSRLDSRWNRLRTTQIKRGPSLTILKDEPLSSRAIADAVEKAEEKYLQGAPESIKQFRDLMNWMQEKDSYMGQERGGIKGKIDIKPITWDEARTHYSALGDRMFSGDLPGNVKAAIRYVREEGLGKELRAGAEKAGVLPEYNSLLNDWSQFESDWKDMSSVTRGGGSPLAIALKAPNAATLLPQVVGKTGDLLIQRLAKYKAAGGSPTTAAAIRTLDERLGSLPKVKAPGEIKRLQLPKEPKIGAPPEPPDPVAIRRQKLIEAAGKRFGWLDIIPGYGEEHLLLKSPAFREWIARQERKETPTP